MQEQLTKKSSTLDRDAVYVKTVSPDNKMFISLIVTGCLFQSKISRLPAYLTIQFVRFCYKGKEGVNAKILKDVKFPLDFDAFDLCTPELQSKLAPMRAKFKVSFISPTKINSLHNFFTRNMKTYKQNWLQKIKIQIRKRIKTRGMVNLKKKRNVPLIGLKTVNNHLKVL